VGTDHIFHLAVRAEWQEAVDGGSAYRRSTSGKSLDEVGFIHCSFRDQVQTIADVLYRGRDDVVLVVIDPTLISGVLRVENLEGGTDLFPHLYGALPLDAVVDVHSVAPDAEGRLVLPPAMKGAAGPP
jgi:uncharacterized protein (DUF952 family)